MSTTDLSVFDLSDLSTGHDGPIPPEVASYPALAELIATFTSLRPRFDRERTSIYALVSEASGAVHADRHALAVAMAAEEDDPGTPATDALAERVNAARRRMQGLGDALDVAHRALLDALREHREEFEAQLDLDQTARRARAVALVDELEANLARAGAPAAALRWMGQVTDEMRTWGGLPALNVTAEPVHVQGQPLQRSDVLHGLRQAA
jgi:hypothetical protein